jgi:hypothetical protein
MAGLYFDRFFSKSYLGHPDHILTSDVDDLRVVPVVLADHVEELGTEALNSKKPISISVQLKVFLSLYLNSSRAPRH